MNIERESVQPLISDNIKRQTPSNFSKKIEDNSQVLIDNEIEEEKRFRELTKKSKIYLNNLGEKETAFNDEDVNFLIKRNFDFIPHLFVDSLTQNQISTVLDETIKQDSDPEKNLFFM